MALSCKGAEETGLERMKFSVSRVPVSGEGDGSTKMCLKGENREKEKETKESSQQPGLKADGTSVPQILHLLRLYSR